jgi:hypothetical protein
MSVLTRRLHSAYPANVRSSQRSSRRALMSKKMKRIGAKASVIGVRQASAQPRAATTANNLGLRSKPLHDHLDRNFHFGSCTPFTLETFRGTGFAHSSSVSGIKTVRMASLRRYRSARGHGGSGSTLAPIEFTLPTRTGTASPSLTVGQHRDPDAPGRNLSSGCGVAPRLEQAVCHEQQ